MGCLMIASLQISLRLWTGGERILTRSQAVRNSSRLSNNWRLLLNSISTLAVFEILDPKHIGDDLDFSGSPSTIVFDEVT